MRKRSTRMALIAVPALIAAAVAPAAAANATPTPLTTIPHTKPLWIANSKGLQRGPRHQHGRTPASNLQPNSSQGSAGRRFANGGLYPRATRRYHHFLSASSSTTPDPGRRTSTVDKVEGST